MVIAQSYDWIVPELKEFRILCMIPSRIPEDLRAKMLWLDARIRFSGIAGGCYFQKSKLEEFLPEVDALMNEIKARALS
jgi:hypothetical protein